MTSNLSAFPYFQEREEATPAAFNNKLSIISSNIAAVDQTLSLGQFQQLSIGSTPPSYLTTAAVTIEVNSSYSDYLYLVDSSAQKSSYIIGSRAGGLADGLNIWDASAGTMIASFSKQSIRFFQNVVGPVFDVGGALADTLNAATFGTGADSRESRIQAAISAASIAGISRVYIPANMYPYSCGSMSYNSSVQMIREGGNVAVWDIRAYGCKGDVAQDDTKGIQSAIEGAVNNLRPSLIGGGGVVYFPTGSYKITSCLTVPVLVSSSILLKGEGMRASYLYPTTTNQNGILFGASTPDASGTFDQVTQFCGMEDLSITGSLLTTGTSIGVQFTEMHRGWMRNCLIEEFDTGESIGLYLRGSTSTVLGAAAGPHCWRNEFHNVNAITSKRPLVLENADENGFYNCSFGLQTGLASGCTAIQWLQGQHNKFYNLLLAGEVSSLTTGRVCYTGLKFYAPTVGAVLGLQIYGVWMEGFDKALLFGGGNSQDAWVYGFQGAVNRVAFDNGAENGGAERTNNVHIFFGGAAQGAGVHDFHSSPSPAAETVLLSQDSAIPSVAASNNFYCSNTAITNITDFANSRRGQHLSILLDSKTTIVHGATILCPGGNNIIGESGTVVELALLGTSGWYVESVQPVRNPLRLLDGTASAPAYAYSSQSALGFYRSSTDIVGLSGVLTAQRYISTAAPADFTPNVFVQSSNGTGLITILGGGSNQGFIRFDDSLEMMSLSIAASSNKHIRLLKTGEFTVGDGTSVLPGIGMNSEASLGLYRSGVSRLGLAYGQFTVPDGSNTTPSIGLSSATSVGFYSSGVQTIAQSLGTLNLATNQVRFSMRTLAASSVTASAVNTNVARNEVVFTIGGASGASLIISSGGTAYIFASTSSAILA